MATIVGVFDRDEGRQNTDINVVVDPEQKSLMWIPRDLWSESLGDRINTVFVRGFGQDRYREVIAEAGFPVQHSLLIWPRAVARAMEGVSVTVPVTERMRFRYPKTPWAPIEDGHKIVEFRPPAEVLSGERIHQWLGARTRDDDPESSGDLPRCFRQQAFLLQLLSEGFDFSRVFGDGAECFDRAALEELGRVTEDWSFQTLGGLQHQTIKGKWVYVREVPHDSRTPADAQR